MLTRRVIRQLTESALFDQPLATAWLCAPKSRPQTASGRGEGRPPGIRHGSSSSSSRWKGRQSRDRFSRDAKVQGLKSRAAFKLLEIDQKYRLFKSSQTVIDLGFAPGSWSQVAQTRTQPNGRVIGIDILPVQPPRGVSTIQGNFLSQAVRDEVRAYVQDAERGKVKKKGLLAARFEDDEDHIVDHTALEERGYVEMERHADMDSVYQETSRTPQSQSTGNAGIIGFDAQAHQEVATPGLRKKPNQAERDLSSGRVVDVLLSDMSAPWPQTQSMWVKSISNVYHRLQNTSGIPFKDHVDSMDLCHAALTFAFDTLKTGGVFVCKFYTGNEDKLLEGRLKKLFERVVREKPEGSRTESKEAYFVALRRKETAEREDVLGE